MCGIAFYQLQSMYVKAIAEWNCAEPLKELKVDHLVNKHSKLTATLLRN